MIGSGDALDANRANWDERVPSHLVAYGVDAFVRDSSQLTRVSREDLELLTPYLPTGTIRDLDVVHLQCHIGLDTLSLARLGANVTGIDFSSAAIVAAREIAARAGLSARFLCSDVDHVLEVCSDAFDVVYTSIGVLCWLPDLNRWAQTVAGLLRPGGLFFVRDAHPILNALDLDRTDGRLVIDRPYFDLGRPLRYDEGTTYADSTTQLANATTYEWQHSLSDIIQSLLDAGLLLSAIGEHRTLPWQALPNLVPAGDGFGFADPEKSLPLAFSLVARSPSST